MKTPTMYAVVTKRLARAMNGEKVVGNPKGTVYGTFASFAKAEAFRSDRKLALVTDIVVQ